jgi:phage replication O-like protein O|nr:MAG TPA: replication protein O [Caudoviricetes sp.]
MSDFIVNSFQLPNSVIDELLADLTGAELKCYLYVLRKTKGWNKEEDAISVSQFMKVTGLSNRKVIDACERLVELGLLEQKIGSNKIKVFSVKDYKTSSSEESSLVKKVHSSSEESSLSVVKKVHTQNNNINNTTKNNNTSSSGKNFQPRTKAKKNVFSNDDLKAAEWIFHLIRKLNPSFREPKFESWANDIRLMRERDNRTHKDICELFQWANQDRFWSVNILSPATLRAKWDQLSMKRNAAMTTPARKETFQERNSTNWGTAEKMAEVF